jgi:hypothetical protein
MNLRPRPRHVRATAVVGMAAAFAVTFGHAVAADLTGLMKTNPVASQTTSKGLYDLERCMIGVDGPSMPYIYRQPDRPERVTVVWDGTGGMGGVSAAAQIDNLENARVTFWGREKILRRITPCLGSDPQQ